MPSLQPWAVFPHWFEVRHFLVSALCISAYFQNASDGLPWLPSSYRKYHMCGVIFSLLDIPACLGMSVSNDLCCKDWVAAFVLDFVCRQSQQSNFSDCLSYSMYFVIWHGVLLWISCRLAEIQMWLHKLQCLCLDSKYLHCCFSLRMIEVQYFFRFCSTNNDFWFHSWVVALRLSVCNSFESFMVLYWFVVMLTLLFEWNPKNKIRDTWYGCTALCPRYYQSAVRFFTCFIESVSGSILLMNVQALEMQIVCFMSHLASRNCWKAK